MRKKILGCILTAAMLVSTMQVMASEVQNEDAVINIVDNVNKGLEYEVTESDKSIMYEAQNADGKGAAEILNKIENDNAFRNGVEEILGQYYDDDGNVSKKYKDFSLNIDSRAEKLLKEYEQAAVERASDRELAYNPKTILVDFSSDISDEYINDIVSNLSEGAYIINSSITVDSNLSSDRISAIQRAEKRRETKSVIINLSKGESTEKAINEYESIDGVVSVRRNARIELCSGGLTNDTYASELWYLDRINASDAWDTIKNANECQKVKIAVIDTGADLAHEDMNGRYDLPNCVDVTGESIVKLSTMQKPYINFHGTAVSGIVNARVNNSIGVAGVAGIGDSSNNYACRVMAIQAASYYQWENPDDDKIKPHFEIGNIEKAVEYAVKKGATVINMSLASEGYKDELQKIVDYAHLAGVTVVAAAGNSGKNDKVTPFYPSDCNHVISVIALDSNNKKWDSSNYGSRKDISAPGVNIKTCTIESKYLSVAKYMEGTSYSAPMVSATAAMMASLNPDLTPADIESIIKSTATDLGVDGKDDETAHGLLNTGLALQRAVYRTYAEVKPVINDMSSPSMGKAKMTWTRIGNEEDMLIYRSTSADGTYTRVGKVEATASKYYSFTDSNAESGKVYYYKIRCRSTYGDSYKYGEYSNKVSCRVS